MNPEIRLATFLFDPKSMIFGVAIFNLTWVWLRSPEFDFHRNTYLAMLLFASSILLLMNKFWSNLTAAIVSGYLPLEILGEFWMFSHRAEVPMFSSRHFSYFFANIHVESDVLLFIGLTLMILTHSIFAIMHSGRCRIMSHAV